MMNLGSDPARRAWLCVASVVGTVSASLPNRTQADVVYTYRTTIQNPLYNAALPFGQSPQDFITLRFTLRAELAANSTYNISVASSPTYIGRWSASDSLFGIVLQGVDAPISLVPAPGQMAGGALGACGITCFGGAIATDSSGKIVQWNLVANGAASSPYLTFITYNNSYLGSIDGLGSTQDSGQELELNELNGPSGVWVETPAPTDSYAYESDGSANFGVIDLTTGAFTACGNSGVLLSGLGVGSDMNIYGGAYLSNTFYSVNRKNGKLTLVAASNVTFWDTGSTTSGVYAVGTDSNLYAIDITTGQGTLIGPTGIPVSHGYYGLSTNSETLYYSNQSTLYKLNLTTGAATEIGTASGGIFGAEVFERGNLYAGSESPLSVYTLNAKTGASTLVSNVTGPVGAFWGLVPIRATTLNSNNMCAKHNI